MQVASSFFISAKICGTHQLLDPSNTPFPKTEAAMEAAQSISAIQSLYQDLGALAEYHLWNLESLAFNLELQVDALKNLLDKKPKSEKSKNALASGRPPYDIH